MCQQYRPPADFVPSMSTTSLAAADAACTAAERAGWTPTQRLAVPFLACGDLAGFDSDQSYPLGGSVASDALTRSFDVLHAMDAVAAADRGGDDHSAPTRHLPVQPPINPPYAQYLHLKRLNKIDLAARDGSADP